MLTVGSIIVTGVHLSVHLIYIYTINYSLKIKNIKLIKILCLLDLHHLDS